jgi:hypothetical protein
VQSDYNGGKDNLFDAVKEHLTTKSYRVRRNQLDLEGNGLTIVVEDSVKSDGNSKGKVLTENEIKVDYLSIDKGAFNTMRKDGENMDISIDINIVPDKKRERVGLLSKFKNKVTEKKNLVSVESTESVKTSETVKSVNLPIEDNAEFDDVKNKEFGILKTEMNLSSDLYLIHRCDVV